MRVSSTGDYDIDHSLRFCNFYLEKVWFPNCI